MLYVFNNTISIIMIFFIHHGYWQYWFLKIIVLEKTLQYNMHCVTDKLAV